MVIFKRKFKSGLHVPPGGDSKNETHWRFKRQRNLSESQYAHYYGLSKDIKLQLLGRSGLTPVNLDTNSSTSEIQAYLEVLRHQKLRNYGFTTQQLTSLGATDAPDLEDIDLGNPIHPLLTHERWVGISSFPLHPRVPDGPGTWTAHNPVVWGVLAPCLRLASQILDNVHCWPW
jgi:hypothetical protein